MKKGILLGATMVATFLAMTPSADAQTQSCECVNGIKCYRLPSGALECDPNVTCEGTLEVTPPIPQGAQPVNSTASVVSITATTFRPTLGKITITDDNTEVAPPTVLKSNTQTQRFPLTVSLKFNATATAEAAPGRTYESVQTLEYGTTTATSIAPFLNERLVLRNNVDFIDQATGEKVFTLAAGSSTITLGPDRD